MDPENAYHRYQEFQRYVAWSDYDVQRLKAIRHLVEPHLPGIVDDFYEEIGRHPRASRTITGGKQQVDRLKLTLRAWLLELFSGKYDREYLIRRWKVGRRHVEIGLDQVYTITAIARIRCRLLHTLKDNWQAHPDDRRRPGAKNRPWGCRVKYCYRPNCT